MSKLLIQKFFYISYLNALYIVMKIFCIHSATLTANSVSLYVNLVICLSAHLLIGIYTLFPKLTTKNHWKCVSFHRLIDWLPSICYVCMFMFFLIYFLNEIASDNLFKGQKLLKSNPGKRLCKYTFLSRIQEYLPLLLAHIVCKHLNIW